MQMHTRLIGALLLAAAGTASAAVTVTYQAPEKFIDVPLWEKDRDQVLGELRAHFEKLGKQLPAGQDLAITVTDVDLAGRVEPRRASMQDLRILRGGADWPSISLHYTLSQDGKVIADGDARMSNMLYLDRFNSYAGGDTLRYEKQMVDEWFQKTFATRQVSSK